MERDNTRLLLFSLGFLGTLLAILIYRQEQEALRAEARYLGLVDDMTHLQPAPVHVERPAKTLAEKREERCVTEG